MQALGLLNCPVLQDIHYIFNPYTAIVVFIHYIGRSNHCYWERNERLNIKICKCSVSN